METKCDDGTLRIYDVGECTALKDACAQHTPSLRNISGADLALSFAAQKIFALSKTVSCWLHSKQQIQRDNSRIDGPSLPPPWPSCAIDPTPDRASRRHWLSFVRTTARRGTFGVGRHNERRSLAAPAQGV